MTTKEKLKNALDALWLIETGSWDDSNNIKIYAGKIRSTLTAPRTKTVEVKRWLHKYKVNLYSDIEPIHNLEDWVELTGTDTLLIPEPEVWEGKVDTDRHWNTCIRGVPKEWIGRRVVVEVI